MGKWHLIDNQLQEIFKEPLIISYRKGKSLNHIQVKAKLWRLKIHLRIAGLMHACQHFYHSGYDSINCSLKWYHFSCAGVEAMYLRESTCRCSFPAGKFRVLVRLFKSYFWSLSPVYEALSSFGRGNMSPGCGVSLFGFTLGLIPHVSLGWGGGFQWQVYNQKLVQYLNYIDDQGNIC